MPLLEAVLWGVFTYLSATAVVNALYLRGRRNLTAPAGPGLLSILIPARNEEANLRRLLPSLAGQQGIRFQALVYDDDSTDGTGAVVAGTGDERIRLLRGPALPPGWVGKVHALYRATREAAGDWYLFLDADTEFAHPHALKGMVERYRALPPDSVLTALPLFAGAAGPIVSGIAYTLLVLVPLPLVPRIRHWALGALNGQCWMISRHLYHRFEPHEAHRGEIVEDIRIGQFFRAAGVVPYFADLQDELQVRMYGSLSEAWMGFRKNACLAMGGGWLRFGIFFGVYLTVFVMAPLVSLWFLLPMYLTKLATDRYARFPLWVSALAPVTFLAWAGIFLDSAVAHLSGRASWKGRPVRRRAH